MNLNEIRGEQRKVDSNRKRKREIAKHSDQSNKPKNHNFLFLFKKRKKKRKAKKERKKRKTLYGPRGRGGGKVGDSGGIRWNVAKED